MFLEYEYVPAGRACEDVRAWAGRCYIPWSPECSEGDKGPRYAGFLKTYSVERPLDKYL